MIDPKLVIETVRKNSVYLESHYKTLDILEGNLEPYVKANLREQFSDRVFKYAVQRMVPINIMPRYVEKLANIYQSGVTRQVADGDESDMQLLSWYENQMKFNSTMHFGNRLYIACQSTLVHPYITDQGPRLRVIPNDRFSLYSGDVVDPTNPTMVILFSHKDSKGHMVYWVYTADEFLVVRSDETIDYAETERLGAIGGLNPYGVLPFQYFNTSKIRLNPVPDTDTTSITEFVPVALTDLNVASMFSSFSVNYLINATVENLTYAPNALWFLKADDPDKDPQIGTLKPQVDYAETLNLIQTEMSLWLGSKGIKSSGMGQLSAESASSGIAKIIDEADTYDVRVEQTINFGQGEKDLWNLILHKMHPVWVGQRKVENTAIFSPSASVETRFAIVPVGSQRSQIIQDQRDEYASGFTTRDRAIASLNPHMTSMQVNELIAVIDEERSIPDAKNLMNGAQVSSVIEVLTAAAIGTIPRDSAKVVLINAFALDEQVAEDMLSGIGKGFTPSQVAGSVSRIGDVSDVSETPENQG